MIIAKRLVKFGLVGILATGIHLGILLFLSHYVLLPTAPANVLAFVCAFLCSNALQQHFTFADRFAGQFLKKRSVLMLFLVNAALAYGLGAQVKGAMIPFLSLVPPLLNYTILHFFSGHSRFKR